MQRILIFIIYFIYIFSYFYSFSSWIQNKSLLKMKISGKDFISFFFSNSANKLFPEHVIPSMVIKFIFFFLSF